MISFTATIEKFDEKGEKTGWRYITVPAEVSEKLKPGTKTSFRVKGMLDDFAIEKTSLLPMGEGDFIIPISATIRKKLWKKEGDTLQVKLEVDDREITMPQDFAECLEDAPEAKEQFYKQPGSHRNYYIKWIESAKTVETRTKRIAQAIDGLQKKWDYGQMIRANKGVKE
jgi:hypothetical protein